MATPTQIKRRGRLSLILGTLVAAVAFAAVTYAADIVTSADLSTAVASPSEVALGDNSFQIKVWAVGNVNNAMATGQVIVVNKYLMATNGTITPSASALDKTTLTFRTNFHYTNDCTSDPITAEQGCAANPFVVNATLAVAAGTADGTSGTVTVSHTGSIALSADATPAQGFVEVDAPPANTAPTIPGVPTLAVGSVTPNQGVFGLTWTASTDDGNPNPPGAVTYQLQHRDANDAGYSDVTGATALSTNSFAFASGSPEAEGTWTYQVRGSDGSLQSAYSAASSEIKVDKSAPNAPLGSTTPASAAYTSGGGDKWFKDSVAVSFTGNGDPLLADGSAGSGVASVTAGSTFDSTNADATTGAFSQTGHAIDGAGNMSSGTTVSGYVDWKNPTVGITATTASVYSDGSGNNWWKDNVSLTVGAADPAPSSGLSADPSTSLGPFTSSGSIAAGTYTATDNVGHSAANAAFAYRVDAAAPTFGSCSGGPFMLNSGMQNVSITAQDETGGSGLDNANSTLAGTVDTSSAAQQSVTFTAKDNVGHSVTKTCYYDIVSTSFLRPVDAAPIMNIAKLGRVIPVKINLFLNGGAVDNTTTQPIYIGGSTKVSCTTGEVTGDSAIDVYAAAGSSNAGNSFRWDAVGGHWIYNFDTSAWKLAAGNCYRINVYYGGTAVNSVGANGALAGYFLLQTTK